MQLLFLIPLILGGQNATENAQAPASREQDADVQAGFEAVRELRGLQSAAEAEEQALRVIEQDLGGLLVGIVQELPPRPVSLSETDFEDLSQVPAEVEKSRVYLAAWRERAAKRQRATELAEAGVAIADGLEGAFDLWLQRTVALRPRLIELQRRVSSGEVVESKLGLDVGGLSELLSSSARLLSERERVLADARGLVADFRAKQNELRALPAVDREAQRGIERIALALGTISEAAAAESEVQARLESAPVETLPTELDRIWQEWDARRESVESASRQFDAAAESFLELSREREAREVPRAGDVQVGEELLEVRRARRDVEASQRLVEYYEADLELLDRLTAARESLDAAAKEATRRHASFSRQTARVFSAIELTDLRVAEGALSDWTRPEEIDPRKAWDAWRLMQLAEADRLDLLADVGSDEAVANARRLDEERIAEERETLRRAEARLRTELSHAEFVASMEERSDEELLSLLAPGVGIEAELERIDGEREAVKLELEAAEVACVEVAEDLREIESPYTRRILQNRVGRQRELTELADDLLEGQVMADASAQLEASAEDMIERPSDSELSNAPQGDPLATARWEEDRLTSQQVFLRILLSYYQRLIAARERLTTATELRRELGQRREDLTEQRVRQVKMRYAAANELASRAASGRVKRAALPTRIDDWSSSASVVRANEELRDWRSSNAEFLERADYQIERLGVIVEIAPLVEEVTSSADLRANLIGTPVSRMTSALTEIEALPDVVVTNLRFLGRSRQAEEERLLDKALKRFSSEAVIERFEEPLASFYLEHANAERVISELQKAESAYARIAEIWRDDRERLIPARAISSRVIAQRVLDYHVMRYATAVARFPGARERIEEAFRKAYGRALPYRLDVREGDRQGAEAALAAAETRLIAQDALKQDLERLLSKAGIELEVSWYREQVSRVRAMLERARSDRDQLRQSIDELRVNYRERLESNATLGIIVTLCIPLIAWILVRLMRQAAKRFEYDVVGELGEHASDRKRRLRTLARTVTAALTVLTWTIAAIYIFAQLGLDITPLVASASVVGLAVAFGAQALIKDFFYGFFILLENQFTVGDVVKLGAIAGTVEKISLRITILRDLKGVVHYIPNGSIGQVSNMTQGWARVVFEVSIPYHEDPDRASELLRDVLLGLYQDEDWSARILEEPVVAGVEDLTDRSIDIRLMIKTRPGRQWEVAREAKRRIKRRLDEAGFASPFPHRVVHHVYEGDDDEPEPEPA
ncbi:MAG: mechanosensitive ion channel [Planctomycetes bacterium]|nr:mechanosensitive ion channel [Planctomycetota bacterium]MCB9903926.1 mechanosensitive ion channel [Planctomycetota bacterium]